MKLNIIKKNMVSFFESRLWWLVVAVFSIYLISTLSSAKYHKLSYFEFVLSSITDHYYIVFFMLISFMFFVFNLIGYDMQLELIRFSRYSHYYLAKVLSVFLVATIFVAIHVLIALVLGVGLEFKNAFSLNEPFYNQFEQLYAYSKFFSTPVHAIVCFAFFMILGLTFIGNIICFTNRFLSKKFITINLSIIYLLVIIALQTNIDNLQPVLFFNNYLILHHAIEVFRGKFYFFVVIEVVVSVGLIIIVEKYWGKDKVV